MTTADQDITAPFFIVCYDDGDNAQALSVHASYVTAVAAADNDIRKACQDDGQELDEIQEDDSELYIFDVVWSRSFMLRNGSLYAVTVQKKPLLD
jgi:hypothetical protein